MKNTFDLTRLDTEALEKLRHVTDPLADETVAAIISSGNEEKINEIFMTLVKNSSFDKNTFSAFDPKLAAILDTYFEQSAQLPDWADQQLIRQAEKVFITWGPEIFLLLNVSSLPMCYTCAKGAQVLYETGRLLVRDNNVDPLARRLMETAQMIVNTMSPGGLSAGGSGLVTIQKVRLIHACIRYYLKTGKFSNAAWDVKKYGEPINQEDLAGTLMSFAPVILTGLKHLNITLTPGEINAYSHCWKVVGHLMGIHEELLPDTYEEGMQLATKILQHQAAESEAGMALTSSCIQFIEYTLPGNAFDDVSCYLIDYFLQDFSKLSGIDLSKAIGVEVNPGLKDKLALSLSRYMIGKISHLEGHAFIQKITRPFNKFLLQGIIHHFNGGKGVHFFLPPSLQRDWGLTDEWTDYRALTPGIFGNRLAWQKKTESLTDNSTIPT